MWDEAECSAPEFLKGRSVGSVIEQKLICVKTSGSDSIDETSEDEDFDEDNFQLNPDVTFREVTK